MKPSQKIAFVVFGNIASGKSSVAQSLVESLPSFKVVCADNIRVESALGGTIMSEDVIASKVMEEIHQHTHIILECTGGGTYFKHYVRLLHATGFTIIRISLKCSGLVCYKRYQDRINNTAAMVPMANVSNVRMSISYIESKISGLPYDLQFNTEKLSNLEIINQILTFYGTKTLRL